ncbi:hypothetical protein [Roseovarius sp. MMSF_3281]|uniref:hypothetical protein n=1 Tax=Roseovarius sp. MMSF_3281 TaxID=3046694 RepID=UPI003531C0B1
MTGRLSLIAVLVLVGAGWGLTTPLSKIAVSEGYRQFGLIFWQLVVSAVLLQGLTWARGRGLSGDRIWRGVVHMAFAGKLSAYGLGSTGGDADRGVSCAAPQADGACPGAGHARQ